MYLNSEIALKELRKVSRGRESHVPTKMLADYVLRYCLRAEITPVPKLKCDFERFAERLYRLDDPRTA